MAVFKDANNREWQILLDGPTIRDVRNRLQGLDLADMEGKVFAKLAADPILLVDVLWVLCREQAEKANISDTAFGRALVGDAIERATDAMLEAIADFFPNRRGKILRAAHQRLQQLQTAAIDQATATLNDPQLEANMLAKLKTDVARALAPLTQSTSATNTPAS